MIKQHEVWIKAVQDSIRLIEATWRECEELTEPLQEIIVYLKEGEGSKVKLSDALEKEETGYNPQHYQTVRTALKEGRIKPIKN